MRNLPWHVYPKPEIMRFKLKQFVKGNNSL